MPMYIFEKNVGLYWLNEIALKYGLGDNILI